ncbi:MAG: Peptidoglycan-binding LysM [Pedosphaera sp.]|nr:Peptidoglycan-binding LysM [Pedosphaera sp.]
MKRFSFWSIICLLCIAPTVHAQPPVATQEIEENYKRLKATVDDLREAQEAQQKTMGASLTALRKEISDLQEQQSKHTGNYATQEELSQLAKAVQEIDRKREADKELILKKLSELGKTLAATPLPAPRSKEKTTIKTTPLDATSNGGDSTAAGHENEDGFNYKIKSGDSFVSIAKVYRDNGVKVTSDQIAKANPNVHPGKLFIGQKIWIPAPKGTTAK